MRHGYYIPCACNGRVYIFAAYTERVFFIFFFLFRIAFCEQPCVFRTVCCNRCCLTERRFCFVKEIFVVAADRGKKGERVNMMELY